MWSTGHWEWPRGRAGPGPQGHVTLSPRPFQGPSEAPWLQLRLTLPVLHTSRKISRSEGPSALTWVDSVCSGGVPGTRHSSRRPGSPTWSLCFHFRLDRGPDAQGGGDSGELRARPATFLG